MSNSLSFASIGWVLVGSQVGSTLTKPDPGSPRCVYSFTRRTWSNHLQGSINVCTEVLHLHGHGYNQSLMFNKEKKLAISTNQEESAREPADGVDGGTR